jgi:hypothetical protein
VIPFLENTNAGSAQLSLTTGPVDFLPTTITPTAAGLSNIEVNYDELQLVLRNLALGAGGGFDPVCIGAGCPINDQRPCDTVEELCADGLNTCTSDDNCLIPTDFCSGILRGTIQSPRIMYDALCNKLGFAACGGTACATTADCPFNNAATGLPGQTCVDFECTNANSGMCGLIVADECPGGTDCSTNGDDDCDVELDAVLPGGACCSPFDLFADVAAICNSEGAQQPNVFPNVPDCCDPHINGDFSDVTCTDPGNVASCCAAIGTDYPSATATQQPALCVNP